MTLFPYHGFFCVREKFKRARRGRLFSYDQYIKVLSEGTEPL